MTAWKIINKLFANSYRVEDKRWDKPFSTLRKKWCEIPCSFNDRKSSKELLKLNDNELFEIWNLSQEEGLKGPSSWYHQKYRNYVKDKKILDFGCGFGVSGLSFSQFGAHVTFVDIIKENVELVRRISKILKLKNTNFYYLKDLNSISELPFDLDLILTLGSIHHAPFSVIKSEISMLVEHLKIGGRWFILSYPKIRWEKEGKLPFKKWGEKTDGRGTPWAEWYDVKKIMLLFEPTKFDLLFYHEWYHSDLNWFDLKLLERG